MQRARKGAVAPTAVNSGKSSSLAEIRDPPALLGAPFAASRQQIAGWWCRSAAERRKGRACRLGDELNAVRTMFVLYTLLIVGGILVFVTVGLTQQ